MPLLTIIAGPNGAGKSTHSKDLIFDPGIEAFDFDKEFYSLWKQFGYDPAIERGASDRASELYEERKAEALKAGKDFAFETNFHTDGVLNVIPPFREKGYEIALIFILLEDPQTAIERVKDRVAKNGHYVSEDTIRERYQSGLQRLNNKFELFDSVTLFLSTDKSMDRLAILDLAKKEAASYIRIPNVLQLELPKLQKFIEDNLKLGMEPPRRSKGPRM